MSDLKKTMEFLHRLELAQAAEKRKNQQAELEKNLALQTSAIVRRFALGGFAGPPANPTKPNVYPMTVDGNRAWLQNWYQNRQIQIPSFQRALDQDRSKLTKPYPNVTLWNNPVASPEGSIMGVTRSMGSKLPPKIMVARQTLDPTSPDFLTDLHEGNHAVNMQPLNTEETNLKAVQGILPPKDNTLKYYPGSTQKEQTQSSKYYDYVSHPYEVHSRIMVLRRLGGVEPTEKITPERAYEILNKNKDNQQIRDLIDMTGGDAGRISDLMNALTSNQPVSQQPTDIGIS